MNIGKAINRVKLTITSSCNLSCNYCFVKKRNKAMSWRTAVRAVDLLLHSPGRDKFLAIYGGEPLLNFSLVEKMAPYARRKAKELRKKLIISLCTNALALEKKHLDFMKELDVKLVISLVGKEEYHDRYRSFENGDGSYVATIEKLPLISSVLPRDSLGVAFCVFPSTAEHVRENFLHCLELGFKCLNFEIIREYDAWTSAKIESFKVNFQEIIRNMLRNIAVGKFIFLHNISWELKYGTSSDFFGISCPFGYKLEVYPEGEMAFSPFLLNYPKRRNYIIGNINRSIIRKFRDCIFDDSSSTCQRCASEYFKGYPADRGAAYAFMWYEFLCIKAAQDILSLSKEKSAFGNYIQAVNKKFYF